jgi:hypothetical protein
MFDFVWRRDDAMSVHLARRWGVDSRDPNVNHRQSKADRISAIPQEGSVNGTIGANQVTEDLRIPFRVLPIRGTQLAESAVLIAGAVLSVAAWILAVSLRHPVSVAELIAVSLLFGPIVAVIGFLLVRRQRRYFGSRGRYWLEIDRDQLTVVTPSGEQIYEWRNLTRFIVEQDERTAMDMKKHVEISVTVYVTTVDSGSNSRKLTIVADDFAAKLPGNPLERAQRFCAILNDLRAWAAEAAINSLSRRMVGGLIVAAT